MHAVAFAQGLDIQPPPAIATITPNTGAQGSTAAITSLAGSGFRTGATVRLHRPGATDIVATTVAVVSATEITCQFALPSTAATGAWNVIVSNSDGQSATLTNGFTITLPALTVTSTMPNTGAQGSTVAITNLVGTGLQSGATVMLQRPGYTDISATNVTVVSPTKITCQFALPPTAAAGAWNVVVTNPGGQSGALTSGFTITPQAPTAAFTATPTSGTAPLAVQFTDTSTGSPTSRSWTFGDGGTSTLQHPSHTYTAAGTYTVVLNISDSGGSNSEAKTGYITVTAPAPAVVQVPTGAGLPTDSDGDDLYEDINGNGRKDFADVVLNFNQMSWIAANEPVTAFDYSGNGRIDFADVVALFNAL